MSQSFAPPAAATDRRRWLAPAGLLIVFGVLLFAWAMDRSLNHDEHQFLAPGALLAKQHLLPFRDYPLFHLPNLAFVYAALDQISGHPILAAKILGVSCTWLVGVLLVVQCYQTPPFGERRWSFPAAAVVLLLLFFDPVFRYTTGKTWNHELPTFFTLAASALVIISAKRNSVMFSALAGACAGIAVGSRLTFAPVLIPLWAAHFVFQCQFRRQAALSVVFTGGALLALAPSFYLWYSSPEAFVFGNLQFPRLRLSDPTDSRAQKTITSWRKARYFFKEIVIPSWPIFAAYLISVPAAVRWLRRRAGGDFPCALIFFVLPFIIAGCFAPSRYQYQHYFVVIPFLAWGVACGLGAIPATWRFAPHLRAGLVLLVIISSGKSVYDTMQHSGKNGFSWFANVVHPAEWFPGRAHEFSSEIGRHVGGGKVLTLAPAWVIETGLPIYPEFATGPFAWRGAHLLDPERRKRLKIVAPADLEDFLAADPPSAILTGVEDEDLERPLLDYARAHSFLLVPLAKHRALWVAPDRPTKVSPKF